MPGLTLLSGFFLVCQPPAYLHLPVLGPCRIPGLTLGHFCFFFYNESLTVGASLSSVSSKQIKNSREPEIHRKIRRRVNKLIFSLGIIFTVCLRGVLQWYTRENLSVTVLLHIKDAATGMKCRVSPRLILQRGRAALTVISMPIDWADCPHGAARANWLLTRGPRNKSGASECWEDRCGPPRWPPREPGRTSSGSGDSYSTTGELKGKREKLPMDWLLLLWVTSNCSNGVERKKNAVMLLFRFLHLFNFLPLRYRLSQTDRRLYGLEKMSTFCVVDDASFRDLWILKSTPWSFCKQTFFFRTPRFSLWGSSLERKRRVLSTSQRIYWTLRHPCYIHYASPALTSYILPTCALANVIADL